LVLAALCGTRSGLVATSLLLALNLVLEGLVSEKHVLIQTLTGHLLCAVCVLIIGRHRETSVRLRAETRAKGEALRALEEREEQLVHAHKMESIGRLAGGIAHDFNNLLTVIQTNAALLEEDLDAAESPELVDAIRRAAERGATLVRKLLAFSRRQTLEPQVATLRTVLDGIETMLRRLVGDNIELRIANAADVGSIMVDPEALQQVVMNLAMNAREAMPEGGILSISTHHVGPGDPRLRALGLDASPHAVLVVEDTGVGMDEETRKRVFEPFFTTSSPTGGPGLGLAMTHGIVEQSGGRIEVESAPEQGAVFRIYFPVVEQVVEPPRRVDTIERRCPGSYTVLLVEDEPDVRECTEAVLKLAGYHVIQADSGHAALELWKAQGDSVDLLLTDIVMPGLSGLILAELLRAKRPTLEVLYISGYVGPAIADTSALSERTFLPKPFTPDQLLAKVEGLLAEHDPIEGKPRLLCV
jgi:signal transduction histidine kinase/ActR/RegA family two-component response regulator